MSGSFRRLLAVSWDMPPLSGPRAVQVSRTLKHLVRLGWESDVVCFGPRSVRYFPDADLAKRLDPGSAVRRVPVSSVEEHLAFRALWRVLPVARGWPDEKWVWIRPATAAALRLARSGRFDAIATFAQPWSDHVVGRRLRRALGLPWVAHFSDPWVDSPYPGFSTLQRRIWAPMEAAVVRDADALVFVNSQTADRLVSKYPAAARKKMRVIPHGYDVDMLPPPPVCDPHSALRLVYTGRFYAGWRTPEHLLRAAALLRTAGANLELIFAGTPDDDAIRLARSEGLADVVRFQGRVTWAESMQLAMSADVLVVIDAPGDVNLFLPSKLIEYLPLKRPILGLTPAQGASADVLRALGYPTAEPDDASAIARVLGELIAAKTAGRLAASPQHDTVAERYDIRRTAAEFAEVLAQCTRPQ